MNPCCLACPHVPQHRVQSQRAGRPRHRDASRHRDEWIPRGAAWPGRWAVPGPAQASFGGFGGQACRQGSWGGEATGLHVADWQAGSRRAGRQPSALLSPCLTPTPLPPPLPQVVPSAAACVRPDGMFCSFSPCIEQVQRTAEMLNAHGFRDIRTMEILLRQQEVSRQTLLTDMEAPPPGPGFGKKHQQQQQQRRRQEQADGRDAKRQRTDTESAAEPAAAAASNGSADAAAAAGPAAEGEAAPPGSMLQEGQAAAGGAAPGGQQPAAAPQRQAQVVARPVPFGRGHTGYLTFARRVVDL